MTDKNKKPFYRKWWFIAIIVVFTIGAIGSLGGESSAPSTPSTPSTQPVDKEKAKPKEDVPKEYQAALKKADAYANKMHMSKKALHDQLTSEYGEKFSKEAADYAIANVKTDYKKNALEKAKGYQSDMSMSPAAIKDQLVSEYGEGFTSEEADYAVQNLPK